MTILAGLPAGGAAGQAVVKQSADDYDYAWGDVAGGGLSGYLYADVATDGTDVTAALQGYIDQAVADRKILQLPPGIVRVTSPLTAVAPLAFAMQGAGGGRSVIHADHAGDGLIIDGSGEIRPNGFVSDVRIWGQNGSHSTPPAARTGAAGLKLRETVQFDVIRIDVHGFDIAYDLVGNCYGSAFHNCRALFGFNNVAVNLRTGPQSGSDLSFFNCWMSGRVAGYYMAQDGGGYRIKHGQMSCGHVAGVGEGVIVAGKDYLTGTTGQCGMITVEGVDFEGPWDGPMIRGHGRITAAFRDNTFLATKGSPNQSARVLHLTNPGASTIVFEGNSTRSTFANDDLLRTDGSAWSNNGGIYESGWVTSDTTTVTPTYNRRMSSLAEWPGNSATDRAKCYAVEHRGGSSHFLMNGHRLRVNSDGVAQTSADGTSWASLMPTVALTQAQYDALSPPDPDTLYVITGS